MDNTPTTGPPAPPADRDFERQLREMNEALLVSSVRQHELAEQAQKAEVRYRRLFETAKDGILILDIQTGRITDANPFMSELLGYSSGEFSGKELWEIGLFSDKSVNEAALRELQEKGYIRYEKSLLETNHRRQVEVEVVANVYTEGHQGAIQCNIWDITQRRKTERALAKSLDYADDIIATLREPLLVLDGHLHVQSVNDSFVQTFHVSKEETENRFVYDLGNGQWDIPSLRRLLEEVLPRDTWVVDFEVRHTFETIGERTMLLNARRMRGTGSNEILLAIEDVTERKRAEARIKNANANLQQKNRELAEFVHTVSHDLKSPLVTIGGMLGLLKEELQEERLVAAGEFIATAEETVVGMRDMIDDLLKLSRIGTVAIDLQPVGLRQVADEFVRKHAPELGDKGTTVSLEISEDQPTVLADRNRLVEVLDNLMVNALKYACDGPEPRISIGSETVGREVRLFVKDNGPGIGKQDHERIFGLFQRLDESKEGTGVGLAIVKRIMEVHGGRVWVESAIGEGATFWLAFPAAVGEAAMSLSANGGRGVHDP